MAQYFAHEVIVRPNAGVSREELENAVYAMGGQLVEEESALTRTLGFYRVVLPGSMVADEAISELVSTGITAQAERNYVIEHMGDPNDPRFGELWGMRQIGAPEAWDFTTGSADILVAVTDTGIDVSHPDLASNVWQNPGEIPGNGIDDDGNGYVDDVVGYDFVNGDNDPNDGHGHGTHCSGTIGASGNDSIGVAGVNWRTQIMGVQVLSASGSGSLWGAAQGVVYAAENGARVVNASWGCAGCDVSYMREAIVTLSEAGGLFVAAAGNANNNNDTSPFYPASYDVPNVISVAATTPSDELAYFSNYGANRVHIAAPGTSILSTLPGNRYASWQGTSMAAPHVAGAAALYLSAHPETPMDLLRERILATATPVAALTGKVESGGRLDLLSLIVSDNEPPMAPMGLVGSAGVAGDVTLRWDPVEEEDVTGYEVSWGTAQGVYDHTFDVTVGESTVIYPSELGIFWYFAVRTVDASGNKSAFSEEVVVVPEDGTAPPQVLDLQARSAPGIRASGSVSEASGEYSDYYGASGAYDGSPSTAWVSEPRADFEEEWITIALDDEAILQSVELTPVPIYPEFFPLDFDVELSRDGVDWTTVAGRRGAIVEPEQAVIVALPPIPAAFVRLRILRTFEHESGYFYTGLGEVGVFRASEDADRVQLTFVAPGDDPGHGHAERYDVRVATELFDADGFDAATQINAMTPNVAGALETLDVEGLNPETTYYFALKAIDEAGNTSPMSNVAITSTLVVPPGAVTDLRITEETISSVGLEWSAPGGDGSVGRAASYQLRYSAAPFDAGSFLDATEAVGLPIPSEAGTLENFTLEGLSEGLLYYIALVAIDESGARGELSNILTVIPRSGEDLIPPTAVWLSANYAFDDVAVSLTATDSSSESNGLGAQSLVDGDTRSAWLSAWGAMEEEEWVVMDAGQTRAFTRFRIYPDAFGAYVTAFPEDFEIQASVDAQTWTTVVRVDGYAAEHATWDEWSTPPVHARYLRLLSKRRGPWYCHSGGCYGGYVHVAEFEAHALAEDRSAALTWVAPGDDDWLGTASDYELRQSNAPISDANFGAATQIETPAPQPGGSLELVQTAALAAETSYYFALRSHDEAGNVSDLSNVASLTTAAVPPAAVSDLAAVEIGSESLRLAFTATGDDGLVGTATSYELRYLDSALGVDNWDFGFVVPGVPEPALSGTPQEVLVEGLNSDTPYWFAMRVVDDAGAISLLSNVIAVITADAEAPGTVLDLVATAVDPSDTQSLAVIVESSSGQYSPETHAALAFDGDPSTLWMSAPRTASTPEELVVDLGSERRLGRLRLRPADTFVDLFPIDFSVEVQNAAGTWLEVVRESDFVASGEWEEWALGSVSARRVRLVVSETGVWAGSHYAAIAEMELHEDPADSSRIRLSWGAPGDDGMEGVATAYDLRSSNTPIDSVSFSSASMVAGVSAPQAAGNLERHEVFELLPETQYCFALQTSDELGNTSAVSNSACATTGGLPPSTVTDLVITDTNASSLRLAWSAPGARGTLGSAERYELRVAEHRIGIDNWESATVVPGLPTPLDYSVGQSFEVDGLSGLQTYHFALRSFNSAGTASPISNNAVGTTLDDIPPNAVTDLVAETDTSVDGALRVYFTAPGDNGPAGDAAQYDMRVSTESIDALNFFAATRVVTPAPRPSGSSESISVTALDPETQYFVALAAIDAAGNVASLSNVAVARTRDSAPSTVSNLSAMAAGGPVPRVSLTWAAPGDDGSVGQVAHYDIRYSQTQITSATFDAASVVDSPPVPNPSGASEVALVDGLQPGTRYFFVLRAVDDRGNESALSNQVSVQTPDEVAPGVVSDLSATQSASAGRLSLSWTATGDDGDTGRATRHHIRWSLSPIDESSWSSANEATGEPSPYNSGTLHNWALSALPDEVAVFVAMKVEDDAGNLSGLSNLTTADTASVAPGNTTDLRQMSQGATSVTLSWTASGDNGIEGRASSYDIRYSEELLTAANFALAASAPSPAPSDAGSAEEVTLSGLGENTAYFVGLQTLDDLGNRSALSNVVLVGTSDEQAPGAISDLRAEMGLVDGSVVLRWSATGDDGTSGTASSYVLKVSDSSLSAGDWDSATELPISRVPGASGSAENFTVTGLEGERQYFFALRVVDESGNESPSSNSAGANTPAIAPARIGNLAATAAPGAATLNFTAVGDDAMVGRATGYDLRYSTSPISLANFDAATRVSNTPTPGPSGSSEEIVVEGLQEARAYWFAIVAIDDMDAESAMSNVVTVTTPDLTAPAAPSFFAVRASEGEGERLSFSRVEASSRLGSRWSELYAVDRNEVSSWSSASSAVPTVASLTTEIGGGAALVDRVRLLPDAHYLSLFPRGFDIEVFDGSSWYAVVTEESFEATEGGWLQWGFPPQPASSVRVVATDLASSFERYYAIVSEFEVYQVGLSEGQVRLSWVAPGDDGLDGRASQYEVYRAQSAFDESSLASATLMPGAPTPLVAGSLESMLVGGLSGETLYHWAVRAIDDAGNAGALSTLQPALSNAVSPATVDDLSGVALGRTSVEINWTATGDDAQDGLADHYEVRYAPLSLTSQNFDSATLAGAIPAPSTPGTGESLVIDGLQAGTAYRFGVRVFDEAGNGSYLSNIAVIETVPEPDVTAPSAVSDLVADLPLGGGLPRSLSALSASSEQLPDFGAIAAVDGDPSTAWSSAPSATDQSESIVVDLGEVVDAGRVVVWASAAFTELFPREFEIRLSPDGLAYSTLASRSGVGADAGVPFVFDFANSPTQFVEFRATSLARHATGDYYAVVSEIEVLSADEPPGTVTVSWTASGDDGRLGTASVYDLRVGACPFEASASSPIQSWAPLFSGAPERVLVSGLGAGEHCFGVQVSDEIPNASAWSNVASIAIP